MGEDGETSCLTLSHVVIFKARDNPEDAKQIASLLPFSGGVPSGNDVEDALEVGRRIAELVSSLGLLLSLTERGISSDETAIIVERAMSGLKDGPACDSIAKLVRSLY